MNCFDCANARFCETWGELKCLKVNRRIYKILGEGTCAGFAKRTDGNILDNPCQCEDCTIIRAHREE